MAFVDERRKAVLTEAWMVAMLGKIEGNSFPREPKELWEKKEASSALLGWAKNLKAQQDAGDMLRDRVILKDE